MQHLKAVADDELLRRLVALLQDSRHTEAELVAHIGEVDARRLYAREAVPSMFQYCTERLHLSGAEAYLRIAAARAAREHPEILTMLADGRLHLTAIALLAPHLTPENRDTLLHRATHRTKREVEEILAELAPRPDAPALIRRLPARRTVREPASVARPSMLPSSAPLTSHPAPSAPPPGLRGVVASPDVELRPDGVASDRSDGLVASGRQSQPEPGAPPALVRLPDGRAAAGIGLRGVADCTFRPAVIEPLAPARYKVQFTASAELRDKLERLQAMMRSSVPDGDLAAVIDAAVTEKLERLESRRFARTKAPRKGLAQTDTSPSSRRVPAAVRRAVHERDAGRCRYVDDQGQRCKARVGLELHHRRPFGLGGDHSPTNVSIVCHAHNRHLAAIDYGPEAIGRRGCSSTTASSRSSPANEAHGQAAAQSPTARSPSP